MESVEGSVGIVSPQDFISEEPFTFLNGESISNLTIRYETYGSLNEAKDNGILICHALSGDHHCAGFHEDAKKPGWWDNIIGPGKPIDTEKYFVISSNCLGGCQGTTGPASIDPSTSEPYNLKFPRLTIADMVKAQKLLLDHLGISTLHAAIGGSMGGMQAM